MNKCSQFGIHMKRTKLIVRVATGRAKTTFTTKGTNFMHHNEGMFYNKVVQKKPCLL